MGGRPRIEWGLCFYTCALNCAARRAIAVEQETSWSQTGSRSKAQLERHVCGGRFVWVEICSVGQKLVSDVILWLRKADATDPERRNEVNQLWSNWLQTGYVSLGKFHKRKIGWWNIACDRRLHCTAAWPKRWRRTRTATRTPTAGAAATAARTRSASSSSSLNSLSYSQSSNRVPEFILFSFPSFPLSRQRLQLFLRRRRQGWATICDFLSQFLPDHVENVHRNLIVHCGPFLSSQQKRLISAKVRLYLEFGCMFFWLLWRASSEIQSFNRELSEQPRSTLHLWTAPTVLYV